MSSSSSNTDTPASSLVSPPTRTLPGVSDRLRFSSLTQSYGGYNASLDSRIEGSLFQANQLRTNLIICWMLFCFVLISVGGLIGVPSVNNIPRCTVVVGTIILGHLWFAFAVLRAWRRVRKLEDLQWNFHQCEREFSIDSRWFCDRYIQMRADLLWAQLETIQELKSKRLSRVQDAV